MNLHPFILADTKPAINDAVKATAPKGMSISTLVNLLKPNPWMTRDENVVSAL